MSHGDHTLHQLPDHIEPVQPAPPTAGSLPGVLPLPGVELPPGVSETPVSDQATQGRTLLALKVGLCVSLGQSTVDPGRGGGGGTHPGAGVVSGAS